MGDESDIIPKLGQLSQLELRSVWKKEDKVFTPWLAKQENLNLLADELGLPPLEEHQREVNVGRYWADLVCKITGTDDYVLIENQIEPSDHKHLGQILTYVVGLDSDDMKIKHVVWVAAEFSDEHLAAITWLNEHLRGKISVFAASIQAWRIDKSEPAAKFQLRARPNDWAESIRGVGTRAPAQGIDINREEYWAAFAESLRNRGTPLKIREVAPRIGFYTFTIDASKGAYIYVYRSVSDRVIGAYLSLALAPGVVRRVYERLLAERESIEREFGGPIDWRELETNKNYRAQIQYVEGNALDRADWERQHAWLADQAEKFYRVFKPRIDAMPSKATLLEEAAGSPD